MGTMPVPKLVITMSLPLMLSLLVQSLYNIVDGIFVGRISEEAFAATSLAYPVQLLMVAVSVGTGVGVNAAVARMVGARRYEEANRIATTGLILSLLGTAVFMIFGCFFCRFISAAAAAVRTPWPCAKAICASAPCSAWAYFWRPWASACCRP